MLELIFNIEIVVYVKYENIFISITFSRKIFPFWLAIKGLQFSVNNVQKREIVV